MTLSEAISTLIQTKGLTILSSPVVLNILDDYKAFNEFPSSKNILKNLISEGYLEKIAFFYDNKLPIGNSPHTYMNELHSKLGFRMDGVCYVLNAVLGALGYDAICASETECHENNDKSSNMSNRSTVTPNGGEHFEFKGVTINGGVQDVADSLMKQGYEFIDGGDDGILLGGKFAGIENCQILVSGSIHTKQTYSVSVFTPTMNTWWSVKADYDRIKEMLQKKYGRPTNRTEFFNDPYEEGDGYELSALSSGYGIYATNYSSKNGEIGVIITGEGQILLTYKDIKNLTEHERAERIVAQNDI